MNRIAPQSQQPKRRQSWHSRDGASGSRWTAITITAAGVLGIIAYAVVVAASGHTAADVESDSNVPMTADRAAAIWVVDHYGVVAVESASGASGRFVAREHLPTEPFVVTEINLWYQPIDGSELGFLGSLGSLTSLDLSQTGVTDEHMHHVAAATHLTRLCLRGCEISEAGFRLLPVSETLQRFTASGSKSFTNESLKILCEKLPNLRLLLCSSTAVTDDGLKPLLTMSSLRDLRLEKTKTTETAVAKLQEQLTRCQIRR